MNMKKGDIPILAHLLTSMKEAVEQLEDARKTKNLEKYDLAKRELIDFQKRIGEIL